MADSDMITSFMSSDINSPGLVSSLEALGFRPKVPGKWTFEEIMVCSQIASAVRGDARAYKTIMDYTSTSSGMPLEDFIRENVFTGVIDQGSAEIVPETEPKKSVRKKVGRRKKAPEKGEK